MFTGIPVSSALALLAGALVALILLHVLRSRHRSVQVVTTLFWSQARSAARPRSFWHRFRYWLTFLLISTFAALTVAAISRPVWSWSAKPARHIVIVLDAGLSMKATSPVGSSRFDEAVRRVEARLSGMTPRDRLAIVLADPHPRLLHAFDEPLAAAKTALHRCTPASFPADLAASTRAAASLLHNRSSTELLLITDREHPEIQQSLGSAGVALRTIVVGQPVRNAAVLSATYVPADQAHGHVQVRVGWWGDEPVEVPVRIQVAQETPTRQVVQVLPGGTADASSGLLQARGQRLEVALELPDAIADDNALTTNLPHREPIAASHRGQLPDALRVALESASVRLLADEAGLSTLHVREAGEPAKGGPQVIFLTTGPAPTPGAPLTNPGAWPLTADIQFESAMAGDGCALAAAQSAHAIPLITAGEHVLAALDETDSDQRCLLLGSALWGPGSTLPNHPAFAQLIGRTVQDLAGWSKIPLELPARRAVGNPGWVSEQTESRAVSLVPADRAQSDTWSTAQASPRIPAAQAGHWTRVAWSELLLLGALLLALVEAGLHVRGRIV